MSENDSLENEKRNVRRITSVIAWVCIIVVALPLGAIVGIGKALFIGGSWFDSAIDGVLGAGALVALAMALSVLEKLFSLVKSAVGSYLSR